MPQTYTPEQHVKFYETTGRWHYSADDTLKKQYEAMQKGPASAIDRVNAGVASKADSISTGLLPRASAPPQPSQWEQSYGRIYQGQGTPTKADSINVGLLPRATAPQTDSFTIRNAPDGSLLRINSRTGEATPVTQNGAPIIGKQDKPDEVTEAEYRSALSGTRSLLSGAANDSLNAVGDYMPPEDYEEASGASRSLLSQHRDTVQRYTEQQTVKELTQAHPPKDFAGQYAQDPDTGAWYFSDGTQWRRIVKQ